MDASNGKIITTMPIGAGTDAAAFDSEKHLVCTSNGEGTITVIQQQSSDKYKVLESVKTELGARTMTLDPKTHNIFLSVAEREEKKVKPDTFHVLIYGR